jgi:hypothetical protein
MMILDTYDSDLPLLTLDIFARLLAGFVTGKVEMPGVEEMKKRNYEQSLRDMDDPYVSRLESMRPFPWHAIDWFLFLTNLFLLEGEV